MKKKRGIISIVLISIIAVIFIIPLVYMVSTSLKPKSEVLQDTISLIGSRVTTENYERAWNAFPFARYMFNSIFVGLATTALTVFTSAMAAYAFARLKFKGRDKVFFVYLSTLMVPIQVTIIQNSSYRFICVQRTIRNRLVSFDGCNSNQHYTGSYFLYNFPEIPG